MKAYRIIFPEKLRVQIKEYEFDDSPPGENEVLFETLYSAISSGTELAVLTNNQDIGHWQGERYPTGSGYAAVGRITAIGEKVEGYQVGDVVFSPVGHASLHRLNSKNTHLVKVPDSITPEDAVYVRFCSVSMTTLRTTKARPGDGVAVFGLGVIGNTAAQVFQASGYEVAGIDPMESRRSVAEACGLRYTLPAGSNIIEEWREKLGWVACKLILDTSGSSRAIKDATSIADIGAEIVLAGVPWLRSTEFNMSELLQPIFTKYLHVRGGWEWEIPRFPTSFAPGSIHQNLHHAMNLLKRKEINVSPLRSHLISPKDAEPAYLGLLNDKDKYRSVVFDWKKLS
jgi:2-desacetyl-2-hydroxyethyl bacteriochlorophyllide A dehydrogenase